MYIYIKRKGVMNMFKLNCTECGCDKEYTTKGGWYNAKKKLKDSGWILCKPCQSNRSSVVNKNNPNITGRPKSKGKTIKSKYHKDCSNCNKTLYYNSSGTLYESIRLKTICNSCSGIINKKGHKLNNKLTQEQILSGIAKREGFDTYEEYNTTRSEWDKYKAMVQKLTNQQPLHLMENNDKRGLCGVKGAYQLDHIIPINYGFKNNIPPKEIASMNNLQIIPWKENRTKSNKM